MKRLFVAIKLIPDNNTLKIYNSLRNDLNYNKIRWVEPEKFHLTLKFIGQTDETKLPIIIDSIKKTIENNGAIKIIINKIGIFGSSYNPRIIWLGVSKNEELKTLANKLINNLAKIGFKKDRQNFIPHFTIGRISQIADKQLFNNSLEKKRQDIHQQLIIEEVILYESIFNRKKHEYKEITNFPISKKHSS